MEFCKDTYHTLLWKLDLLSALVCSVSHAMKLPLGVLKITLVAISALWDLVLGDFELQLSWVQQTFRSTLTAWKSWWPPQCSELQSGSKWLLRRTELVKLIACGFREDSVYNLNVCAFVSLTGLLPRTLCLGQSRTISKQGNGGKAP